MVQGGMFSVLEINGYAIAKTLTTKHNKRALIYNIIFI